MISDKKWRARKRYIPSFLLYWLTCLFFLCLAGELADKASEKVDEAKDKANEVAADAKEAGQGIVQSFGKVILSICDWIRSEEWCWTKRFDWTLVLWWEQSKSSILADELAANASEKVEEVKVEASAPVTTEVTQTTEGKQIFLIKISSKFLFFSSLFSIKVQVTSNYLSPSSDSKIRSILFLLADPLPPNSEAHTSPSGVAYVITTPAADATTSP